MSYKYNYKDREQWIESFNCNFKNQTWHNDKVYHPSEIIYSPFFEIAKQYTDFIDPKNICGIEYAWQYNCPSFKSENYEYYWLNLLHDLKRLDRVIDNFTTKETLLQHIHNNIDEKVVKKYGNHLFTISGQHRLCISKFIEIEAVEVFIIEYKLNKKLFSNELNLDKNMPYLINNEIVTYYQKDLKTDFIFLNNKNKTYIVNKEFVHNLVNRHKILKKAPYKAIINILKTFCHYLDEDVIRIQSLSDLRFLDRLIINKLKK